MGRSSRHHDRAQRRSPSPHLAALKRPSCARPRCVRPGRRHPWVSGTPRRLDDVGHAVGQRSTILDPHPVLEERRLRKWSPSAAARSTARTRTRRSGWPGCGWRSCQAARGRLVRHVDSSALQCGGSAPIRVFCWVSARPGKAADPAFPALRLSHARRSAARPCDIGQAARPSADRQCNRVRCRGRRLDLWNHAGEGPLAALGGRGERARARLPLWRH
jgi:hypothetical protein